MVAENFPYHFGIPRVGGVNQNTPRTWAVHSRPATFCDNPFAKVGIRVSAISNQRAHSLDTPRARSTWESRIFIALVILARPNPQKDQQGLRMAPSCVQPAYMIERNGRGWLLRPRS